MTDANDSSQLQTGALLWCGGIPGGSPSEMQLSLSPNGQHKMSVRVFVSAHKL